MNIKQTLLNWAKNQKGDSGAITAGILICIIGFATLIVGNYIVFAISTSLPVLANDGSALDNTSTSGYNSTLSSTSTYVTTVLPIFGLALMVLGFAIILYTLRTSMGGGDGGR